MHLSIDRYTNWWLVVTFKKRKKSDKEDIDIITTTSKCSNLCCYCWHRRWQISSIMIMGGENEDDDPKWILRGSRERVWSKKQRLLYGKIQFLYRTWHGMACKVGRTRHITTTPPHPLLYRLTIYDIIQNPNHKIIYPSLQPWHSTARKPWRKWCDVGILPYN